MHFDIEQQSIFGHVRASNQGNVINHVKIEDIPPEVFNELLRFIYTGRSTSAAMETMAVQLLVAADKYLLDQLKSECEFHLLIRRISADKHGIASASQRPDPFSG